MNDFFASVEPDKKLRIINAALREFAKHGYKNASTNRIVEAAGIGKGMLFYYFNSKQELYQFLVEYTIESVKRYFVRLEDPAYDSDFIERYRVASKIKLEAYMENPRVFDFLSSLYLHKDKVPENEAVKKCLAELETLRGKYLKELNLHQDMSKFRTDIPTERLVRYVVRLMDGYIQEIISGIDMTALLSDMDLSGHWTSFDECIDDLKLLFYGRPTEVSGVE